MIGVLFVDGERPFAVEDIQGLDLLEELDGELADIITHYDDGLAHARSLPSPMPDDSPVRVVSPAECGKVRASQSRALSSVLHAHLTQLPPTHADRRPLDRMPLLLWQRTHFDIDCKDTDRPAKKLKARVRFTEPLRDDSDYVIDVKDSRLASTQRNALKHGRSTGLSWQYTKEEDMLGAFCDGVWFGREELLSLSTISS